MLLDEPLFTSYSSYLPPDSQLQTFVLFQISIKIFSNGL